MNIEAIRAVLPHRYPFLLIDRALEVVPGERAEAIKCVSANEPFFQGHFPQQAVMPGVLILEALAQTGALAILGEEDNQGKIALLAGVDKARFRQPVVPGDVLTLSVVLTKRRGPIGKGQAVATVAGKEVASCELMFAIQ